MSFWKRSKRPKAQARAESDTGQARKKRKSVKRSPPLAMEVKILALDARESGLSADEVGELIGVGPSTVHRWRRDYAAEGIQALRRL